MEGGRGWLHTAVDINMLKHITQRIDNGGFGEVEGACRITVGFHGDFFTHFYPWNPTVIRHSPSTSQKPSLSFFWVMRMCDRHTSSSPCSPCLYSLLDVVIPYLYCSVESLNSQPIKNCDTSYEQTHTCNAIANYQYRMIRQSQTD